MEESLFTYLLRLHLDHQKISMNIVVLNIKMIEETSKFIEELFKSLLKEYQEVFYVKKDSGYVFDHGI